MFEYYYFGRHKVFFAKKTSHAKHTVSMEAL